MRQQRADRALAATSGSEDLDVHCSRFTRMAGRMLTRDAAERVARNWWVLLVNGLLLIVAGVPIFSIDWSVRSLSIFIGALFILQGISTAFARGLDRSAEAINAVTALLSMPPASRSSPGLAPGSSRLPSSSARGSS
jgi:hypothetical protein